MKVREGWSAQDTLRKGREDGGHAFQGLLFENAEIERTPQAILKSARSHSGWDLRLLQETPTRLGGWRDLLEKVTLGPYCSPSQGSSFPKDS